MAIRTKITKKDLAFIELYSIKELVNGQINPPSFTLNLEIPAKKALFSLFFSYILHKTNFRKEKEGLSWRNITTWEDHFDITSLASLTITQREG